MNPYDGSNPILKHFSILRPQLWDAPEWERVAFVLHHATLKPSKYFPKPSWEELTDALAEIVPEQREFWLRVQATWNKQCMDALTHMFKRGV